MKRRAYVVYPEEWRSGRLRLSVTQLNKAAVEAENGSVELAGVDIVDG